MNLFAEGFLAERLWNMQSGFRAAAMNAVKASYKRTKELGK